MIRRYEPRVAASPPPALRGKKGESPTPADRFAEPASSPHERMRYAGAAVNAKIPDFTATLLAEIPPEIHCVPMPDSALAIS